MGCFVFDLLAQTPAVNYPGIDGFLNTRGSLMLDVVFLAMFAAIPFMGFSIYVVKFKQKYALHKRLQIILGLVLLAAVTLFEIDIRIHGWQERAAGPHGAEIPANVWTSLYIHLFFAVTTAVLWIVVYVRAFRNFPSPPVPGPHSTWHLRWAKIAAIDMLMTSITGWIFYYLAFVTER